MKSKDVPQATIERVVEVARAVAAGATSTREIADAVGESLRHAGYGVRAARTLKLVAAGDGGRLSVTKLGHALAETFAGTPAEAKLLKQAIAESSLVDLVPDLLSDRAPNKGKVAGQLMSTGLNRGTAQHRAQTMLSWRRRLGFDAPYHREGPSQGWWRRIELKNYRSIEKVAIDLAPFTLVVGPNGSGKSNFADALVFARDVAADASVAVESRGGILGVRRWRPTKPTDVTVDIRAARSRAKLDANYVRHSFTIHSGKQGDWSFSKEVLESVTDGKASFRLDRDKQSYSGTTVAGQRATPLRATASMMVDAHQYKGFQRSAALRNVRRYRISPDEMRKPQYSSEKTRLEENGANIAVAVRDLRRSQEDFALLVRTMAKIVPGLTDIYDEQIGRYISLKFKQAQAAGVVADFNATEMSEGALRALGIVVASLQMKSDELLVVEEPEVSLHVGATTLLFDVLKRASARGAVLVTTHSVDLLDAAKEEEILVCEYRDGVTHVGPLADAQRKLVRDGLFSLAELVRTEPLRIEGAPSREFKDEE